jgi:hypothetical protein
VKSPIEVNNTDKKEANPKSFPSSNPNRLGLNSNPNPNHALLDGKDSDLGKYFHGDSTFYGDCTFMGDRLGLGQPNGLARRSISNERGRGNPNPNSLSRSSSTSAQHRSNELQAMLRLGSGLGLGYMN